GWDFCYDPSVTVSFRRSTFGHGFDWLDLRIEYCHEGTAPPNRTRIRRSHRWRNPRPFAVDPYRLEALTHSGNLELGRPVWPAGSGNSRSGLWKWPISPGKRGLARCVRSPGPRHSAGRHSLRHPACQSTWLDQYPFCGGPCPGVSGGFGGTWQY